MARQPEHIIPFRPFSSSARSGKSPMIVKDDRRKFYESLPGIVQGNEVLINPTGAWPVMNQNAPPLQEALRLTIKRPEPITLYFHPWANTEDRFRQSVKLWAHASSSVALIEQLQGRIIIEFGVGQARNWAYCDMAPGSLHIPACQWVTVYGWTHTSIVRLAVSAQVGYPHSHSDCIWSAVMTENAALAGYSVEAPHFARELTGYFYSSDVLAEASIAFQQLFSPPGQYWLLRPAITPNPQVLPYAPVDVPISVGYVVVLTLITPGAGALDGTVGVGLRIRI